MSADTTEKNERINRWMEYAVPLLGFGGAILGIVIWADNVAVDVRISIIGCMLSSFVLAYLAWIRPRRDIVALSTPIYTIIFLGFPLDALSTVVLDVLYALSLTLLLVRLKRLFGASGTVGSDKTELTESIRSYVDKTRGVLDSAVTKPAHSAAIVFAHVAQGDYFAAARASESAIARWNDASAPHCVKIAFAIVKEQAECLDKSFPRPEQFLTFPQEDAGILAKTPGASSDKSEEHDTALENALLLLFACAWIASEDDREILIQYQDFVMKLLS